MTKGKIITQADKIAESELLALVASKLQDRELFPKKVEAARKYLRQAKMIKK